MTAPTPALPATPARTWTAAVHPPRPLADADLNLRFDERRGNVLFDVDAFSRDLGVAFPPVLLDWLEVAAGVFLADLAARRGHHEAWTRNLRLIFHVRERERWEAVLPLLHEILYGLSADNIALEFRERRAGEGAPAPEPRRLELDGVALLSGGLDSFAGGLDLLQRGKRPFFLSHKTGNPTVIQAQRRAHRFLEAKAGRALPWHPVAIRARSGGALPFPADEERDDSQRMRSFLYLSLACVAAWCLRVETVWVHENGILTYPVPLTAARIGSRSTRSTHPVLLRGMEALAEALVDWRLAIQNPFHLKTKQDVVQVIARADAAECVADLVSCWRIGRIAHPCGTCLPCLLRRFALAGLDLPEDVQEVDLLRDGEVRDAESAEKRRTLGELLRLVHGFAEDVGEDVLVERYPDLLNLADGGASLSQIVRLYRRFASQSTRALERRYPAVADLL